MKIISAFVLGAVLAWLVAVYIVRTERSERLQPGYTAEIEIDGTPIVQPELANIYPGPHTNASMTDPYQLRRLIGKKLIFNYWGAGQDVEEILVLAVSKTGGSVKYCQTEYLHVEGNHRWMASSEFYSRIVDFDPY